MTARRRFAAVGGAVAAPVVLVLTLTLLGVVPVRAYVNQQRDLASTSQRLAALKARNGELRDRVRVLKTDDEVVRLAREQFGMVRPGEKLILIAGLRPDDGTFGGASADAAVIRPVPPSPQAKKLSTWRVVLHALAFWN